MCVVVFYCAFLFCTFSHIPPWRWTTWFESCSTPAQWHRVGVKYWTQGGCTAACAEGLWDFVNSSCYRCFYWWSRCFQPGHCSVFLVWSTETSLEKKKKKSWCWLIFFLFKWQRLTDWGVTRGGCSFTCVNAGLVSFFESVSYRTALL